MTLSQPAEVQRMARFASSGLTLMDLEALTSVELIYVLIGERLNNEQVERKTFCF